MGKSQSPATARPTRPTANGTADVDAYMARLDHRLKSEVDALRKAIRAAAPGILEQVKWNAPSFRTEQDYLCTFNLRPGHPVLLVFHNPLVPQMSSPILEGAFKDRRIVTFADAKELEAKTPEVVRIVAALAREMQA
jgi:hypothetical protein